MMYIILSIHIISGVLALGSGFYAIVSKKRRGTHSKSGNLYFYSMLISAVTAVLLSTLQFQAFLFAIALFTLYLIIGGKMAILIRRRPRFTQYWKYYVSFGLLTSVAMALIALNLLSVQLSIAIILFVFAGIQAAFSIVDLFFNPGKNAKKLIFQHINKMGGGYIATCTAFIVVNIHFLPEYITWLGPTLIGSILITMANRQRRKLLMQHS